MKRFIAKCFCLQVAILLLLATSLQVTGQRGTKFVKYCSLFDRTYEGKTVSSSALMFYSTVGRVDGDDTFLYSADCNGADYFAIPEGNSRVWRKWQNFFDKLQPEKLLALEIKFEGKPNVETAHLFGSLDGWARAQIRISKIISIRDVTSLPIAVRPNNEAPRPQIQRIEGMRKRLQTFLQTLWAPSSSNAIERDSLSEDFTFADSAGTRFNKNQYFALDAAWTDSFTGFKESRTISRLKSKSNKTMIWRGTLNLLFASGLKKTFNCDISFVLRDGTWIINQATMLPAKPK